jgi:subtilisin family serine protease
MNVARLRSPRRCLSLLAALAVALAVPAGADAARFAVGLTPGGDASAVAQAIALRTSFLPESLAPIPALVVDAPAGTSFAGIRGIRYVEVLRPRHVAYVPTDPLTSRQRYLVQSRFYESWITLPSFEAIPVAVIDSGVDFAHPDLQRRILDTKSFVGGSAKTDTLGHGTFVAGIIAAEVDNGIGIAGLAPSAELLVAKVVTKARTVPVAAEARAIRWAVEHGARVINLSLGGLRDPLDPELDSYSQLEADAIAYAVTNGVVVTAAVGNDNLAPKSPWGYASYPAALPHVLGVSAYGLEGDVPKFSNRDRIYNDLAAPGEGIFSVLPRTMTSRFPACSEQGYSNCGPDEYREAQGTSFSTPQVSAAAAVLLSLRPTLRPEQVTTILERTAVDLDGRLGCAACPTGRDQLSGWGRLDVAAAIAALASVPLADRYEANDNAGPRAFELTSAQQPRLNATLDFWDDQDDVYGITLKKDQSVYVGLTASALEDDLNLALWLPKTLSIEDVRGTRLRVRVSARPGAREYFSYRAPRAGVYFVQVRMSSAGASRYRLVIVKSE